MDKRTALIVFLGILLVVGVAFWVYAGFSFDLSRFFAREDPIDTSSGGPAPTPVSSAPATTPSSSTALCEPVKPTDDWKPPANAKIQNGVAIAPNGKPYCTPPTGADVSFPTCFNVDYTDYKKEYTNFADLNAIGDPLNLVTKYGTRVNVVGYRGMYQNLCPWTVHYSFRSIGSKQAGTSPTGPDMTQSTEIAFQRTLPPGAHDAVSCWNSGTASTCEKEFPHEILYTINTYTCGRVFAGAGWDHFISGGGPGPLGNNGFNVVFNYGRDCTGSSAEKAPGSVTAGTGGSTGTGTTGTCQTLPQAPTLGVQCGASQNVLTWTNTVNTCSLSILRSVDGGNATFLTSTLPLSTTTYTDAAIQSGHSYTYRIKNHPSVSSNAVTCTNGVQTANPPGVADTFSPTPVPTSPPGVTPTPSGATTPTPTVPLTPTPIPSGISGGPTGGTSGGAGGVSTGPGDATVLALLVSAIVSLLYVTYTHSMTGMRREISEITKDQDPLDFRS